MSTYWPSKQPMWLFNKIHFYIYYILYLTFLNFFHDQIFHTVNYRAVILSEFWLIFHSTIYSRLLHALTVRGGLINHCKEQVVLKPLKGWLKIGNVL